MLQLLRLASTRRIPQMRAVEYFSQVLSEHPFPWEVKPRSEQPFRGWSAKYQFGPLCLHYGGLSPCELRHGNSPFSMGNDPYCTLLFVRRGAADLRVQNISVRMPEGACALLSGGSEFNVRTESDMEGMVVHLNKEFVRDWAVPTSDGGVQVYSQDGGWGRALQAYLYAMSAKELAHLPLPPEAVASQLGGMLALASGGQMEGVASTHGRSLLRRMRDVMRERYRNEDLSPTAVAAELGISRRYLHGLFAAAGSSFGSELMEMRLQAAKGVLRNRLHAGKTVAEIAFHVGFKNSSHFTRVFRLRFGLPPRAFREGA